MFNNYLNCLTCTFVLKWCPFFSLFNILQEHNPQGESSDRSMWQVSNNWLSPKNVNSLPYILGTCINIVHIAYIYAPTNKPFGRAYRNHQVHPYICPSVCISVHLSVYLSICLYICPSVCIYVHLSVYLSICPYICPSVPISVHLYVYLSICLYISKVQPLRYGWPDTDKTSMKMDNPGTISREIISSAGREYPFVNWLRVLVYLGLGMICYTFYHRLYTTPLCQINKCYPG